MGIFFDDQGTSYGTWRQTEGKLDSYEAIVPLWRDSLAPMLKDVNVRTTMGMYDKELNI